MDWKTALSTFGIVFLAELGDKTQLATILLAGQTGRPWSVLLGAVVGFAVVTGIAVAAGTALQKALPERAMEIGSAILFIAIGGFLLARALIQVAPPSST